MAFSSEILEEIALEGLDGITIDALWVRLSARPNFILPPDNDDSKRFIWNIVRRLSDVDFYQLETPRLPLIIFNRYDNIDDELGMVMEPDPLPVDIYPHSLVNDVARKVMGSCSTYDTRKIITKDVRRSSLEDALKNFGGNGCVIVASQYARSHTLMGTNSNPNLEITILQYCTLERIGRSRYHGEVTQGKLSLQVLGEDTKTIFYYRKFLLKHNFIVKQPFHLRSQGIHLSGLLLHLPRFYQLVKPKFVSLTETIIGFLKEQPNFSCEYGRLRDTLEIPAALKKLAKMPEFQKYVRSDPKVPYRSIFPEASVKEWKHKGSDKEKSLRVFYLLDPKVDVREVQRRFEGNYEDEDEDEDDDGQPGILDESRRYLDMPLLTQCAMLLKKAGKTGLSQTEISKEFGLTKLQVRAICRMLLKMNVAGSFMWDVGRQRVTKFYLKGCQSKDEATAEFTFEEEKLSSFLSRHSGLDDSYVTEEENNVAGDKMDISFDPVSEKIEGNIVSDKGGDGGNVEKPVVFESKKKKKKALLKRVRDHNVDDEFVFRPIKLRKVIATNKEESSMKPAESGEDLMDFGTRAPDVNTKKDQKSINEQDSVVASLSAEISAITGVPAEISVVDDDVNDSIKDIDVTGDDSIKPVDSTEESIKPAGKEEAGFTDFGNIVDYVDVPSGSSETSEAKGKDVPKIKVEITDNCEWLKQRGFLTKDLKRVDTQLDCKNNKTLRILRRSNLIVEAVFTNKVISDLKKIQMLINESELKEGYQTRIDRKSLLRILYKLTVNGHIKIYKVIMSFLGHTREQVFVCGPNIKSNHPLIASTIELAKLKFSSKMEFYYLDKTVNTSTKTLSSNISLEEESKSEHPSETRNDVDDKPSSDTYHLMDQIKISSEFSKDTLKGTPSIHIPKFMRMKSLHKFIFYLIYSYEGRDDTDQEAAKLKIKTECESCGSDVLDSLMHIYVPSISWKMFVPPLPEHQGYCSGWALLADILLRLPLSIFMELFRVPYIIKDINVYLDHPVKRHILVKDLPGPVRNCITVGRKYIFSIFEVLSRLVYIGLVQLGPQQLKDKDHIFLFLNRNGVLYDTVGSKAGYHKISADMEYPMQKYRFETLSDVEQYWHNMWKICMHTRLGSRNCVIGTDLILENIQDKKDIVDAMRSRGVEEAVSRDVGYIPGDGLGAAGFDSALFSHLKRNWSFKQISKVDSKVKTVKPMPRQGIKRPYKLSESKNQAVNSLLVKRRKNHVARRLTPNSTLHNTNKILIPRLTKRNPRIVVRHVQPKKPFKHRKPYYDQIDREALLRMSKLRVDWSKPEDKMLLLCKVVYLILCPHPKKTLAGNMFVAAREALHRDFPCARNKTSRACQRRIHYMMRSSSTCHSINLCVEELRHDPDIMKEFGDCEEKLKAQCNNDKTKISHEWNNKFRKLLAILRERYNNFSLLPLNKSTSDFFIPDTVEEFNKEYSSVLPTKMIKEKAVFAPVENITDIYSSVMNATIHSTLCSSPDKTSWSYHLFSIYQQYPEKLLRSVLAKLRSTQVVSLKKYYHRAKLRSGNYLPLTASPYQLSITYINLIQTRYYPELYVECYDMLENMIGKEHFEVMSLNGGSTAAVVQLNSVGLIKFDIEIPDQVIVLNPNIQVKDETYTRLMQRYQDILMSYRRELLTTSVLFQKDNYACLGESSEDNISENVPNELFNPIDMQQYTNVIAKAASRIALYMVRDSDDKGSMEPQEMQHAHDFFVVNSCNVFTTVKKSDVDALGLYDEKKLKEIIQEIRNSATFPVISNIAEFDLNKTLDENFNTEQCSLAKSIMERAEQAKALGITHKDIAGEFGNDFNVVKVLEKLRKLNLLLRTGVACTRYVHYGRVRAWLVHSYRNIRQEKDERVPVNIPLLELTKTKSCVSEEAPEIAEEDPIAGPSGNKNQEQNYKSVAPDNAPSKEVINERMVIDDHDKNKLDYSSDSVDVDEKNETRKSDKSKTAKLVDTQRAEASRITKLPKSWTITGKEYERLENQEFSQPIRVIMRPWIRIDGTINRRVLDAHLSSVLGHIMLFPAVSLSGIHDRFSPVIQPQHARELCEILMLLGCVKSYVVERSGRPSLLSKPVAVTIKESTGMENEANIRYEADKLAIIKFGSFLSTRSYSENFISLLLGR